MTDIATATVTAARARADRIRAGLDAVGAWLLDVLEARRLEDHVTLGYATWEDYMREEFPASPRLTKEQRRIIEPALARVGMTHREIGSTVGVSKSTVTTELADQRGQNWPKRDRKTPKPTRREIERRRDIVADLRRQGASIAQIMNALGVVESVIQRDLKARGLTDRHRAPSKLPVDPDPVDWHDPPNQAKAHDDVAYRHSVTLEIWSSLARESREQHHINRLAFDADDAENAGDTAWLTEAEATMSGVIAEATRLRQVIVDHEARMRGRREEDGAPPPRGLRAVT